MVWDVKIEHDQVDSFIPVRVQNAPNAANWTLVSRAHPKCGLCCLQPHMHECGKGVPGGLPSSWLGPSRAGWVGVWTLLLGCWYHSR